jgi:hypothetical protein
MLPDPELARILAQRRLIETQRKARDTGFLRDLRPDRTRVPRPTDVVPRPVVDPDPGPPPWPRPEEGSPGWAPA